MKSLLMSAVRDEFEANRTDLEEQISKLLGGETWKIEVWVKSRISFE
jgi:hypothetical protein